MYKDQVEGKRECVGMDCSDSDPNDVVRGLADVDEVEDKRRSCGNLAQHQYPNQQVEDNLQIYDTDFGEVACLQGQSRYR